MAETEKIRHTFHMRGAVLNKLRDVVRTVQVKPERFEGLDIGLYDNLSRFAETAVINEIARLEKRFGKVRKRRKDVRVHFGRPPASQTADV